MTVVESNHVPVYQRVYSCHVSASSGSSLSSARASPQGRLLEQRSRREFLQHARVGALATELIRNAELHLVRAVDFCLGLCDDRTLRAAKIRALSSHRACYSFGTSAQPLEMSIICREHYKIFTVS